MIKYVSNLDGVDVFAEPKSPQLNSFQLACQYSSIEVVLYLFYLYLHRELIPDIPIDLLKFINTSFLSPSFIQKLMNIWNTFGNNNNNKDESIEKGENENNELNNNLNNNNIDNFQSVKLINQKFTISI